MTGVNVSVLPKSEPAKDHDLQPLASVNAVIVANKPATAVLLMIVRSEKKGLIVIVPLPM